jgi:hypothetical protein
MKPESPSPYPQVPATCPYPEPTPSSPHYHLHECRSCHHGMARPQVADGGTAFYMVGTCEFE